MIKTITNEKNGTGKWQNLELVKSKLDTLLDELIDHPGFGELKVNVKIMKDGRKEVILSFGKEYRFILIQATNMADEKRIV